MVSLKMNNSSAKGSGLLPGVILCLIIGGIAWCLARYLPVVGKLVGGPVFAILIGILLGQGAPKPALEGGIRFAGKKLLQLAIILIGFGMNVNALVQTGSQSLLVMLGTISAALIAAFFVGKLLRVPGKTACLIGVGTAICGGSAIAATAPVIDADDDEVAYAISTIFLFNILAVFIFPALGHLLGLSDIGFGMWAGTAINDTSSVVAAGYSYSDAAGDFATIVKLTRTLMIIPITMVLAFWRTKQGSSTTGEQRVSMTTIFPWFVLGFLITTLINSIGFIPKEVSGFLNDLGKFGIMVAMAGIGLNTKLRSLVKNGWRPIALGLCCWILVAVISLIMQSAIGIL